MMGPGPSHTHMARTIIRTSRDRLVKAFDMQAPF
jgi:hypothetical protein